MTEIQDKPTNENVFSAAGGTFAPAMEFITDAAQRTVLFLDVMRQRGNAFREHAAKTAPHVLDFQCKVLIDPWKG